MSGAMLYMLKLSNEEMQAMALFSRVSGVAPNDVVFLDESVVFLVPPESVGRAVGRGGANVRHLSEKFGKRVNVYAVSEDAEKFVEGLIAPVELTGFEVNDGVAVMCVPPNDKGRAIGRGGEKINRARALVKRRFGFKDLKIT